VWRACLASASAAHLLDREAYGCDIDPGAIGSGKIGVQELLNERSCIHEDATAHAIYEPMAVNMHNDRCATAK